MSETCHECHNIVNRLNIEFNELYNKYEILKDKRYDEIINELYFRLDVIQNQNSVAGLTEKTYDQLHENIVEHFGSYAGYAQQFLFKMERDIYKKKWL